MNSELASSDLTFSASPVDPNFIRMEESGDSQISNSDSFGTSNSISEPTFISNEDSKPVMIDEPTENDNPNNKINEIIEDNLGTGETGKDETTDEAINMPVDPSLIRTEPEEKLPEIIDVTKNEEASNRDNSMPDEPIENASVPEI